MAFTGDLDTDHNVTDFGHEMRVGGKLENSRVDVAAARRRARS